MNKAAHFSIGHGSTIERMRHDLAQYAGASDDSAWGLPGEFYADAEFFEHERKTVLRNGWHCVGRSDELTEAGDFLTLDLLDEPLIIVRNDDGVQALSNVCKHRGMPLAAGTGNAKRFVCPYHAWTYGIDGALLRAPRMQNAGFDAKTCRLGQFACQEQFGFIYVNLSDTPEALDLAGLQDTIAPYQPEDYHIAHSATEIWNTNWKCLVENFMEGYHLSVVHPQTLHGYTPTGLSKKGPSGAWFTSYFANYPNDIPSRGKGSALLSDEQRHRSFLFSVFPTQVVSISATLLVSLSIRPIAVDRIEVRWTLSTYGEEVNAETVAQRIALWEEVNKEDREKLERMQQAFGSVHALGGPLAGPDYEGTVWDFLVWLAQQDKAGREVAYQDQGF